MTTPAAGRRRRGRRRRAAASSTARSCGPTETRTAPGPRSRARRSPHRRRAPVELARRLVAAAHLAEHERPRARRARRSGAAASACDRGDTAARSTSSMNSTQPSGGSNAYGVPSDAASCVSVPPNSGPAASPVSKTSTGLGRAARRAGASPCSSAQERRSRRSRRGPRDEPALDHRPVERRDAALAGQPRQERRVVAVADEQLRARRCGSPASSSGSSCTLP